VLLVLIELELLFLSGGIGMLTKQTNKRNQFEMMISIDDLVPKDHKLSLSRCMK